MRLSKNGMSFLSSSTSISFCIPVAGFAMLSFMASHFFCPLNPPLSIFGCVWQQVCPSSVAILAQAAQSCLVPVAGRGAHLLPNTAEDRQWRVERTKKVRSHEAQHRKPCHRNAEAD